MTAASDIDLSEIETFMRGRGGLRCAIDMIRCGEPWGDNRIVLADEDRQKLEAALSQDRFSHTALSLWLKSKGVDLGSTSIGRHRSGGCRCARS